MGKQVIHWRGGQPVKAYYEAARPDQQRKRRRETGSADTAVLRAGLSLREQARHLDQNHDIARGVLDVLVKNTIGHAGIQVDPMPRDREGRVHKAFARRVRQLWRDWEKKPEVTHQLDWPAMQRLIARTRYRDGEALIQQIKGVQDTLDHGTKVPYSLEAIEPDLLPMDYNDHNQRIVAGVQHNGWGRPRFYHLYREHPGSAYTLPTAQQLRTVPADRILHAKLVDRFNQTRGVSIFASVLLRLDDIKDYEESERIAAKVAASMAAYIKKGDAASYDPVEDEDEDPRDLRFRPGMVFDTLMPGEEIGTIDTSRPNTNLQQHRDGQLRAVASGTNTTASSISKNYDGTYSAQRQELVEGWGAYQILAADFVSQVSRPVYEAWIQAALEDGQLLIPQDLDPDTINDAQYIAPQMPWIDPQKEANSFVTLESAGYISAPEIIRRTGRNPDDVLEQETAWREQVRERGMNFDPVFGPVESEPQPTQEGGTNARVRSIK